MKILPVAALLALAALALPASAKTYYVDAATGNDNNNGLKADQAFATIQKAIDKAAAGSTILVAPGEYQAISTNNKKLTIKAVEGPDKTSITAYLGEAGEWQQQWNDDIEEWVDVWVPFGKPDYAPAVARLGAWGTQTAYTTIYAEKYSNGTVLKCYQDEYGRHYLSKVPASWLNEYGGVEIPDGIYQVGWNIAGWRKKGTETVFKGGKNTVLEGFALENGPRAVWGGTVRHCVIRNVDNGLIDYQGDFETGFCKKSQWALNAAVYRSSLSDCTIAGNANTPVDTRTFTSAGGFVHGSTLVRCSVEGNVNVTIDSSTLSCCLVAGNSIDEDPDSGGNLGSLVWASDLYNCTVACNPVGNYTMDVAEWGDGPAAEGEEGAWYDESDGSWHKTVRGRWRHQETTEDDEDGWYDETDGKYYKSVFVPYENDTDGIETGPNVAVSWCNVYGSVVWGNVDGDGNPANVRLDRDVETGKTVARDYMNFTGQEEDWATGEPYTYAWKAWCTMMNSLVEDILVEQKGNNTKKGYKNSTGNLAGDPLFLDATGGEYRLSPDSPCVDAGADYTKKTGKYDLDSGARKVGKVDMGAYEFQKNSCYPADYDGDGLTDMALYVPTTFRWYVWRTRDGFQGITFGAKGATPVPGDYDGDGKAEPAYFAGADAVPVFVRRTATGDVSVPFGAKGATPFVHGGKFAVYTANAKKPAFSVLGEAKTVEFGTKGSKPVSADFDGDGEPDLGTYTATATKPAFAILQSGEGFDTKKPFLGKAVALGAKGAVPCCADFDNDGAADFGTYLGNSKAPCFQRLFSTAKFRELRTMPMGTKGCAAAVGEYDGSPGADLAVYDPEGVDVIYCDAAYADQSFLESFGYRD